MDDTITVIKLAEFCTARDLSPFIVALEDAKQTSITLDATDVTQMSSPCLQVVLCAEQDWKLRNKIFEITNLSNECHANLALLGADGNWSTDEVKP